MPVLMGGAVECEEKWERLVEGLQGRVEVERKMDAHEELPDEANWYSKATMTSVKLASESKVSQGSKTPKAAKMDVDAATWVRQDPRHEKRKNTKSWRDSVPKCRVRALFPLQDRGRSTPRGM